MDRTQSRTLPMPNALDRIRKAAGRNGTQRFTSLMHHVYEVERLRAAYLALRKDAAAGVDRVTWQHYGKDLEANLQDLSSRLARGGLRVSAGDPPAMMPTTISGSVPNVGGHSVASSTPSRPLVPAPTYTRRPPIRNAETTSSMVLASGSRVVWTTSATRRSSAFRRSTISSADARSISSVRGFLRSVSRESTKSG